ncbi:MAG: sn-glycerol-3-phosphate ABC transporter ATP-binding protein UgpC [Candidatus Sericytochromatia bacterium]|nr:sn-glycerol-3-phosphate ABC transporter ATP-binding protein UgpC [Candidatus Sericytochromatia bacterium]
MAKVDFDKVEKRYGDNVVIRELSLSVEDKEFLVLVGPSGCGKSTALRMIAGLEEITGGHLRIGEVVVNDLHPKARDIAMVFQNYALYPHMTVYENMAFALKLRKLPVAEIDTKVREAARSLEIEHLLERKPKALSGGQRQRVAIGRAIVREPKVFLMDEPLSNLDAKLRVSMRAEIKKLHQRLATTFVYVTHDQTEAMTLGDRIAVMRGGDLQQHGSPLEVYDRPANLFVATFIGSPQMNLFDAVLEVSGGRARVTAPGLSLDLPAEPHHRPGKVVVGLRPEHLEPGQASGGCVLEADVDVVETLGSESYVHLSATSARGPALARVPIEATPAPGARAVFSVRPARVHLFDPSSEKRLG